MATSYLLPGYVEQLNFHNVNKTIGQSFLTIDTRRVLLVSRSQTRLGNKRRWQTPHRLIGDTFRSGNGPPVAVSPQFHTAPLRTDIRQSVSVDRSLDRVYEIRSFRNAFFTAILPFSNANRSQPVISSLTPSDPVAVKVHSDTPRLPLIK